MRLTCPFCGPRDSGEFYYYGAADYLNRPHPGADEAAWEDYLYLRQNPAGVTQDLWYHEAGCRAWLRVSRSTLTHAISAVDPVAPRFTLASQNKEAAR